METYDFDYEQMLLGELYMAGEIQEQNKSIHGKMLAQKINQIPIENQEEIKTLEKQLFGKTGEHFYVNPPLHVDYGRHIEVGENFYANMECIFLDVNRIIIGNNVMLGPRVGLYTAGHPIDPEIRQTDLEFGLPITIEDNVWIGGNAVILPNVTIGKNSIVAAGSVVTKNVPQNVIVAGNPARVLREVNEQDRRYWQEKSQVYLEKKKQKTVR